VWHVVSRCGVAVRRGGREHRDSSSCRGGGLQLRGLAPWWAWGGLRPSSLGERALPVALRQVTEDKTQISRPAEL
jgi:hypothetical protein